MKTSKEAAAFARLQVLAAKSLAEKLKSSHANPSFAAKDSLASGKEIYLITGSAGDDPNDSILSFVMDADGKEHALEVLEKEEKRKFFGADLALDPALILKAARPSGGITISPKVNKLVLKECDRFDEKITVRVPKDPRRKVDVYFLADSTGSMSPFINAVKAGANNIFNALSGLGHDIAYGVGNYKDVGDPYVFQHQLAPSVNNAAVQAALNAWSASGGGDLPEGQLFALQQLGQPAGGSIGWRNDAKKIVVWFGDAPGHDPRNGATEASATANLVANNVSVIAISVNGNNLNTIGNQGSDIAAATGGSYSAGINAANIVNTIIAMINALVNVINNLSLVASGDTASFVTHISPAGGYGPLSGDKDHVLEFDVSFTGNIPCADKDQVFNGSLDVVADGEIVAAKKVEIRVPACCRKRMYSYSVKYVIGRKDPEECNVKMAVNPGNYTTEINLHNYHFDKRAVVRKWITPLVIDNKPIGREPRSMKPVAADAIVIPAMHSTMDDTYRLADLLGRGEPSCRFPLSIGWLHIVSSVQLAVTAVYTSADFEGKQVSSMDVEQIQPMEIPWDAKLLKPGEPHREEDEETID